MSDPLFDLVKQRPIDERVTDLASCPSCGPGAKLTSRGVGSTLLGWSGKDPNHDPNHRHERYICHSCKLDFCRETKSGNCWYTVWPKVLRGMPSCFEHYDYECSSCSGVVTKHYTALDGVTKVTGLSYDNGRRLYRTFYSCAQCKKSIETDWDFWRGSR